MVEVLSFLLIGSLIFFLFILQVLTYLILAPLQCWMKTFSRALVMLLESFPSGFIWTHPCWLSTFLLLQLVHEYCTLCSVTSLYGLHWHAVRMLCHTQRQCTILHWGEPVEVSQILLLHVHGHIIKGAHMLHCLVYKRPFIHDFRAGHSIEGDTFLLEHRYIQQILLKLFRHPFQSFVANSISSCLSGSHLLCLECSLWAVG